MTPKEKAEELIEKYNDVYEGITLGIAKKHWTKQSALIAVDEILKDTLNIYYWQEVKQEIEKL
jgi:hypothetical protein